MTIVGQQVSAPSASSSSGNVDVSEQPRKRVLFVDDEPSILEGLRNVLRSQRKEWDMVFALGGPAGVAELEKGHFDVVVTDMRMPMVDGATLLKRAKQSQPDAVRLVLSGQTDADTVLKTVFVAHQFMSKPCEPDRLRSIVKRSCELHAFLASEQLRRLAGDVNMLPPAPRVFMNLVNVLGNPKSTVADAAKVVERDPALCAKILQIVNSAFFGLSRRVSSVEMAANYLGSVALRNLALSLEAAGAARSRSRLSDELFLQYQHNVVLGATLARAFCKEDRRRADDAFIAAMLRDMGWHLHSNLQAEDSRISECIPSHAALGAYLLGLWGLPHALIEAVAFHEHPEANPHEILELADIVHLTDRIAAEVVPSPFETERPKLCEEQFVRLGVAPARVAWLRDQARVLSAQVKEYLA